MKKNTFGCLAWFALVAIFTQQELLSAKQVEDAQADLVVFSYDRPLQLYAFLESAYAHMRGVKDIFVLSLASTDEYEVAYEQVYQHFNKVMPVKQDRATARANFKPHLRDILENKSTQKYVVFATDDIVVCDKIDVLDCIDHLSKAQALGFYLRLGKNITEHYALNKKNVPFPAFEQVAPGVLQWAFKGSAMPWGYPHTVDMTVYEKAYVLPAIKSLVYRAPNTLEGKWHKVLPGRAFGLCYEHSKMVNLPLNLVQHELQNNRHEELLSTADLLKLWQHGFKMDIGALYKFENKSPHEAYEPSFIVRT